MLYLVHITSVNVKQSFRTHKSAFQAFKVAARKNQTAALWHCNDKGKWKLVHRVGFYPDLTDPLYDSYKTGAA